LICKQSVFQFFGKEALFASLRIKTTAVMEAAWRNTRKGEVLSNHHTQNFNHTLYPVQLACFSEFVLMYQLEVEDFAPLCLEIFKTHV